MTEELQRKTTVVNRWITDLAPVGGGYHGSIFEAVNYSVKAGGKRIRPVLSLAVCEMLGGSEEDVMPFACAIEFIHTYSLIHDDLPCMDDDDLRRGLPTSHKKFGEALALLAGDALLNHAFEVMSNAHVPSGIAVEMIKTVSHAGGIWGMIGGQVIDMKGADTYEELVTLYRMKTGALITAAGQIGVIAAKSKDESVFSAVSAYTDNLGIAFQIRDDLLDVLGDEQLLGKRVGHDEATGKRTFVSSLGIDGARMALEEYTQNAKKSLSVFGERAAFLSALADYLLQREH